MIDASISDILRSMRLVWLVWLVWLLLTFATTSCGPKLSKFTWEAAQAYEVSSATAGEWSSRPATKATVKLPRGTTLDPVRTAGEFQSYGCLAVSSDNRFVAAGDAYGFSVWDVAAGVEIERWGERDFVSACAFLANGTVAFTSNRGLTVVDPDRRTPITIPTASDAHMAVDGQGQLFVSDANGIRKFDFRTRKLILFKPRPKDMSDTTNMFVAGGSILLQGLTHGAKLGTYRFDEGTIRELPIDLMPWDIPIASDSFLMSDDHGVRLQGTGKATQLRSTSDGRWYSTLMWDEASRRVGLGRRNQVEVFRLEAPSDGCTMTLRDDVRAMAMSGSGNSFVVGMSDGGIVIGRSSDCTELHAFAVIHLPTTAMALDDSTAVVGSAHGIVAWSLVDGTPLRSLVFADTVRVMALAMRPDGTVFAGVQENVGAETRNALIVSSTDGTYQMQLPPSATYQWQIVPAAKQVFVSTVNSVTWIDGLTQRSWKGAIGPGIGQRGPVGVVNERLVWVNPDGTATRWNDSPLALATVPDLSRVLAWQSTLQWRDPISGASKSEVELLGLPSGVVHSIRIAASSIWLLLGTQDLQKGGALWHAPIGGGEWQKFEMRTSISSFEISPNGRWVLARAIEGFVHVIDSETQRSTQIATFQDGSWASLRSDGGITYSGGLAPRASVRLPNSKKRTIESEAHGFVGTVASLPYQGGALMKARVRGSAPPSVRIGPAEVRDLKPNRYLDGVYDVVAFVENGGSQELSISVGNGAESIDVPHTHSFDVRNAPKRVLVIGNENYRGRARATGAAADADSFRRLLERRDGWALQKKPALHDLKSKDMRDHLRRFLEDANENETLLLYYAGHAEDRTLLPIDYNPQSDNGIHASELAGWLSNSRAQQIAIVIDACYGGSFSDLKVPGKAISVFAASSKDGLALSGSSSFTSTLIRSLPSTVDSPVSLRRAFNETVEKVPQQSSFIQDNGLGQIPLLIPTVSSGGGGGASGIAITGHQLVGTRGALTTGFSVFNEQLIVEFQLGSAADSLAGYIVDQNKNTVLNAVQTVLKQSAGSRRSWSIPIGELKPGTYKFEIWPCAAGKCSGPPAEEVFTKK